MYYAAVNTDPATGLAIGVHVPIDEVFFFPCFRDDTLTDIRERKRKWGELVRNGRGKSTKENLKLPAKYDPSVIRTDAKHDFFCQVSSLIGSYDIFEDPDLLKSAKGLLERVLKEESIPNSTLHKLANGPEPLSDDEALNALNEFELRANN